MSNSEVLVSRALREILPSTRIGDAIVPDRVRFKELEIGLCRLIPEVLGEVYPAWKGMALDSVRAFNSKKSGDGEMELFGACELLSNFRWMLLHLKIATEADAVTWMECRVAEKMPGGISKTYEACETPWRKSARVEQSLESIDWMYKVTFGEKRS